MIHPEVEGDLNLAIVRLEQAGKVIQDRFNAMRGDGSYNVVPSRDELLADLHSLTNHLMVARAALARVEARER